MLNVPKINALKPKDKDYKVSDEKGLHLLIKKNGAKYWRLKYRINGSEKLLSLGVYPEVTLKEAREARDIARTKIKEGNDPSLMRKLDKAGCKENTFQAVAEEFLANNAHKWSESHKAHIKQCYERDVFPWIGARPLKVLTAIEVLATLRRIIDRGALETAARTKQFIGQAIRYGVVTGKAERDITQDLKGALPSPVKGNYSAIIDPTELVQLLKDIKAYQGSFIVRTALQLQPMIFARPANLVAMRWDEINFDAAQWVIPAEQMKMGAKHIVPLSRQAIHLLNEIKPLSGRGEFVFPSDRGKTKTGHISRETPGAIIRRLGYKDRHTVHGFRTTASTLLHEQGFNSDTIERQLAHAERNSIKAAYCRAEYLPERVKMMQVWSDYLESLVVGGNVITGNFRQVG